MYICVALKHLFTQTESEGECQMLKTIVLACTTEITGYLICRGMSLCLSLPLRVNEPLKCWPVQCNRHLLSLFTFPLLTVTLVPPRSSLMSLKWAIIYLLRLENLVILFGNIPYYVHDILWSPPFSGERIFSVKLTVKSSFHCILRVHSITFTCKWP